jgi:hypothetical protein
MPRNRTIHRKITPVRKVDVLLHHRKLPGTSRILVEDCPRGRAFFHKVAQGMEDFTGDVEEAMLRERIVDYQGRQWIIWTDNLISSTMESHLGLIRDVADKVAQDELQLLELMRKELAPA